MSEINDDAKRELQNLRTKIDDIDNALMRLLADRFEVTRKVGLLKAKSGMPAQDKAREAEQFARIAQKAKNAGLNPDLAQRLMRLLIDQVIDDHIGLAREAKTEAAHGSMLTVGIIGLGAFGRFAADILSKHAKVLGTDVNVDNTVGVTVVDLPQVCQTDVVLLAVPLSTYDEILPEVKKHIKPDTVLIDICSVKMKPAELLARHLPDHNNILLTHPLFGPQSAADGTRGHELIVTSELNSKTRPLIDFCEVTLGLNVQHMSPEQHDKLMAQVHALTFFVARGLSNLNLQDQQLVTPSYKMILDLVRLDKTQSEDLFRTVELGNPFGHQEVRKVVDGFEALEHELSSR